MSMFISLNDLAELHGVKTRRLLGSTIANTDEAIKQSVMSGNMAFFQQVIADWAKSATLARHTAATPAEIAKYFARPDVITFTNELYARVKGGGSGNSGSVPPPMPLEVLDPNTPGTSVPGETFTVTETTPDPVVSSPTQGATTPPPPVYTPPPAYTPPPVVAPPPIYTPPASTLPPSQTYYPPTTTSSSKPTSGGMVSPGADPWGDAVPASTGSKPSGSTPAPTATPSTALIPGVSNVVLAATGLGALLLLGAIVVTRRSGRKDNDRRDRDQDRNRDDNRERDMRQNKGRRGKARNPCHTGHRRRRR